MCRCVLVLLVMLASQAIATTIHVPGDATTIQEGIDIAQDSDTVLVAPGSYNEVIDFLGKGIVVTSSHGPEVTKISARAKYLVSFISDEDTTSVLSGFSLRGNSTQHAIYCEGSGPLVRNCDMAGFAGDYHGGAAVLCVGSAAKIRDNVIHNNGSIADWVGCIAVADSGAVEITGNQIFSNSALSGPAITCISGSRGALIAHNTMWNSRNYEGWGGGIFVGGSDITIHNNTIVGDSKGIVVWTGTGIDVRNNLVADCLDSGILPREATCEYNLGWNNGGEDNPGAHGLNIDPQLTSVAGIFPYALSSASPCINAGDPATGSNDPDGTRNDIGAVPFSSTLCLPANLRLTTDDALHVVAATVSFAWSFYDTTANQAGFQIQVGGDVDWSIAEMWDSGPVWSADSLVAYGGASLKRGKYYVYRVRVNNGSYWGGWVQRGFRVNSPPANTHLIAPVRDTCVHYKYAGLEVGIVDDPEGDDVQYEFQWRPCSSNEEIPLPDEATTLLTPIPATPFLEGLTKYEMLCWRCRTYDGLEYSHWTAWESFKTRGPTQIQVPSIYPNIQAGINNAYDGDTVLIDEGTYSGPGNRDLHFNKRPIMVKSRSGPEHCILDCAASAGNYHRAFEITTDQSDGLTIEGIKITNGNSSQGGAIRISESNLTLRDCVLENSQSDIGGAVYATNAQVVVENCILDNSAADWGGAVVVFDGSLQMRNCTLVSNQASHGSAIYLTGSASAQLANSIFAFNTGTFPLLADTLFYPVDPNAVKVECSDIFGNDVGDWLGPIIGQESLAGNFAADPLFCNPASGDFRIRGDSPCAPANSLCRVLVGAGEVGCLGLCGDVDGDAAVGINDVVALVQYLFQGQSLRSGLSLADANCDAVVNIADVTYLTSYIFTSGPRPCASCR